MQEANDAEGVPFLIADLCYHRCMAAPDLGVV